MLKCLQKCLACGKHAIFIFQRENLALILKSIFISSTIAISQLRFILMV